MTKNPVELRRKRYFKLSSQIAQLDNAQLRSLFDHGESNESSTGWGINHAIVLGPSKVFVKRIPVTNIEFDNLFSTYELVLFLEYIPHVLETWLRENPNKLQKSLDELRTTIAFLRTKGVIHFDAHFRNILTDGEQTYLTDFGLALDKNFMLTKEEESFFERNTFYDYGEILRNLGQLIQASYDSSSETDKCRMMKKYGIQEYLKPHQARSILLDNIEQIHADGDLKLDKFYVASIVKYRSIIALMQDFFADMWENKKKDTKLPHAELRLLLKETGFLPDSKPG